MQTYKKHLLGLVADLMFINAVIRFIDQQLTAHFIIAYLCLT